MKQFGKKKILLGIAAAASVVLAIAGGIALRNGKSAAVEKADVVRGSFEDTYTVSAKISFGEASQVISEVSGRVLQTCVTLNQQVKAGDVLMRIDPSEYE